jgi:hypothetical protein
MAKREDEKICSEVPLKCSRYFSKKQSVEKLILKGYGEIRVNQFK